MMRRRTLDVSDTMWKLVLMESKTVDCVDEGCANANATARKRRSKFGGSVAAVPEPGGTGWQQTLTAVFRCSAVDAVVKMNCMHCGFYSFDDISCS
jgi:hypothetical protein